jgi:hypothetical protein
LGTCTLRKRVHESPESLVVLVKKKEERRGPCGGMV